MAKGPVRTSRESSGGAPGSATRAAGVADGEPRVGEGVEGDVGDGEGVVGVEGDEARVPGEGRRAEEQPAAPRRRAAARGGAELRHEPGERDEGGEGAEGGHDARIEAADEIALDHPREAAREMGVPVRDGVEHHEPEQGLFEAALGGRGRVREARRGAAVQQSQPTDLLPQEMPHREIGDDAPEDGRGEAVQDDAEQPRGERRAGVERGAAAQLGGVEVHAERGRPDVRDVEADDEREPEERGCLRVERARHRACREQRGREQRRRRRR